MSLNFLIWRGREKILLLLKKSIKWLQDYFHKKYIFGKDNQMYVNTLYIHTLYSFYEMK